VGHTLMKWLFSFSRDDVVYLIRHFCELDKPFFYSLLNFNGEDVRAVILFFLLLDAVLVWICLCLLFFGIDFISHRPFTNLFAYVAELY